MLEWACTIFWMLGSEKILRLATLMQHVLREPKGVRDLL